MSRNEDSERDLEKRSKKYRKRDRKMRIKKTKKVEKRIFSSLFFIATTVPALRAVGGLEVWLSIENRNFFFIHNYSISCSVHIVVSDILMSFIHGCLSLLIPHWAPLSTRRWDFLLLKSGLKFSFSVLNVVGRC